MSNNSIGNVELKVTLGKENIANEALKIFKDYQKEVDKNTITYKIAGDKSSLESVLKEIKGFTPELLTKLKLDFDKSDYDKQIGLLKGTTDKTAKQIGEEFKSSISSSLKGFSISEIIGDKKLSKDNFLNTRDISKIKESLQGLINQTNNFDLSKVTSVKEIENQVVSLNKMKIILESLHKYSNQESIKIDGNTLNIAEALQKNTTQINSIMDNVGGVIKTKSSQWATTLESTFNNEFSEIINLLSNLQDIINGTFKHGSGNEFGKALTDNLQNIQAEIDKTTKEIEELETKLKELNNSKNNNKIDANTEARIGDLRRAIGNKANTNKFYFDRGNVEKGDLEYIEDFKKTVNDYMLLGGKLEDVENRFGQKYIEKFNIKQILPPIPENISQEIARITNELELLKAKRDELLSRKQNIPKTGMESGDGSGAGTGGSGTPTSATVSPVLSSDFKQKLQEQVSAIGAIDATVSGKLSETFKSDVQTAVDNVGKVDVGVSFTDGQKDGKKQEIPVNVTTTPKLSETFQSDLQKLVDDTGKYKIKIDTDSNNQEGLVPINVKVGNGEDFKSELKNIVEGDNGLDIKINPVIDKDFKLEINDAVLKDVKVEGSIQGGNLKPETIEAPTDTSSISTKVENVDGKQNEVQKEVQQELEKTKQKQEEVGKAAQKSSDSQKRSLLEVVKELEHVQAEHDKAKDAFEAGFNTVSIDKFAKEKGEEIKKNYTEILPLIDKIEKKLKDRPEGEKATKRNTAQYLKAMILYVEQLQYLMKDSFSFEVLGKNGEEVFNSMKVELDKLTSATSNSRDELDRWRVVLDKVKAEKLGLEKNASEVEQLEVKIYNAVKALEKLKATNKKGNKINVDSKAFEKFWDLWLQYKSDGVGGKLGIADFTNEAKVINTVAVQYNKELEIQADRQKRLIAQRKQDAADMKKSLKELYPDIDLNKYTELFKQIESGQLRVKAGFEQIKAAQEALKTPDATNVIGESGSNKIEKPLGKGEVIVTPRVEDPSIFTGQVTEQIKGQNATLSIVPKIEDPVGFANQVTEQLKGQSATIDVKPNIDFSGNQLDKEDTAVKQQIPINLDANIESFNTSIQSKKEQVIPVDVKLSGNIESLNASIQSRKEEIIPADINLIVSKESIENLNTLDSELNKIAEKIQKIVEKPLSVTVDYSSIKSLYEVGDDGKSSIDKLKASIDGLQTGVLSDLKKAFHGFSIDKNLASRIEEVAKSLSVLKITLNNIDPNSTGFLNTIKELSGQATGLKELATVISASKEKIKQAKDEIDNAGKKPENKSQSTDKEKYTILKDTLKEVLRLTKEYNKEKNAETKSDIALQIQSYKDKADTLQLELWDLEKVNEVEQSRIDIIQKQIKTEEQRYENKELASIEAQIAAEERLETELNDQYEILKKDSNEWQHALDVLDKYKNTLKDIVKITRNVVIDSKTGFRATSYQFSDSDGNTKTVGANEKLLMENTKVADLNELYRKLKTSANEYYSYQSKILKGDTSTKTQTESLFAYNKMLQAQKDIFYWKEKGLVPSKEQLQIEEMIVALAKNYKEQEQKTGLENMYETVLNTVNRLNEKQKEVNDLRLKADGTKEFTESIQNAQDNVSVLIGTLRGFKFEDFFTPDSLSSLGLNGSSLLFDNNDLSSFKWVINQLPFTEEQIQKINDALDENTLIKEKNIATENKRTNKDRTKEANDTYKEIEDSLKKQADLTKKIIQSENNGKVEISKELDRQLVDELRNFNNLILKYKSFNDVVKEIDVNLEKLFSDSRSRIALIGASAIDDYKSQTQKSINSFNQKDQLELYNSLSKAVQQYIYWLKKEKTETGSAKEIVSAFRQESESLMNSLRTDIKSYGLKNLEKELDLDRQILEARREINYQDEKAVSEMAKSSYERELNLEERKARLKMNNIGKDAAIVAKNDVRIKHIESLIKKEQEYRQVMGLEGKAHEAAAQLINKKTTLTNNLKVEQEAYNASVEAGNKDANVKLSNKANSLAGTLSNAITTYTRADESKLAEAKTLLSQLQAPSSNWNVNSNNVDSIVKKIQSDTNNIINALKTQHDKITEQTKYNSSTSEYAKKLEEAFKNIQVGNAKFLEVSSVKGDGSATIKFIEQVDDKVRTTTLSIKDMDAALKSVKNFNVNDGNYGVSTGNWNTVKSPQPKQTLKDVSDIQGAYEGLISTEQRYQTLKAKYDTGTATKSDVTNLNLLIAQREQYNEALNQTTVLTEKQMQLQRGYEKAVEKGQVTYNSVVGTVDAGRISDINVAYDEATRINTALNNTKQLMSQAFNPNISGFQSVFDRAQTEVDELNKKLTQGNIDNIQTGYTDKINKIISNLNKTVAVVESRNIDEANQAMLAYANTLNNGNVKIGNFTNNNKTLTASFEVQKGVMQEVVLTFNETTGAISMMNKGTKKAQSTLSSFIDGLKTRFMNLGQYLLTFASFYRVFGYIRQGVTYIRELDSALTEMRKVSDETVKSLRNFQDVSFDIASSIGSTAVQIQQSSADFMRLGYSLEEASKLAKDANIYANVGDMEIDVATEHMISSIKAWQSEFSNEVEASSAIVDRYNEIGNNFAISSADIGSAMERSAAALKAGGNTLNESLGLITAGNIIQQDAETTAAALKIMALRIRGSKTELEEMGEDTDDLASSTSKLREEIKALSGVDIMADDNTYKSTAQIVQELGKVYDKMSDVSQAALLEKIAGKNRASTVAGLLENYEVIDEVIKAAENASGSALEENLRYMESIEGKIAQFTNEVQEFWHNLIDSDTVKGFIDTGTKILDILSKVVDSLGLIGTLGATLGTAFGLHALKKNSGGRDKKFSLTIKYATESFNREVCEF